MQTETVKRDRPSIMYTVPFEARHLTAMRIQAVQEAMRARLADSDMCSLESQWATTLMLNGCPIVCGGAIPIWEGRAFIWSFLSDDVDPHNFVEVTGFARRFLDGLPFNRVEASVECDHVAGHRWMRALGFELEAPRMRAFTVDKIDCSLYARVNEY